MDACDDPRIQMARVLARHGTTHGSTNDLGKALIMVIDYLIEAEPAKTAIGREAIEGKPPPVVA